VHGDRDFVDLTGEPVVVFLISVAHVGGFVHTDVCPLVAREDQGDAARDAAVRNFGPVD
jgi:hypothetical protein